MSHMKIQSVAIRGRGQGYHPKRSTKESLGVIGNVLDLVYGGGGYTYECIHWSKLIKMYT